jgi:hypothetical protein
MESPAARRGAIKRTHRSVIHRYEELGRFLLFA